MALTRAKSSLFILGNAATLERSNDIWRSIILDSRSRSSMTDVSIFQYQDKQTLILYPDGCDIFHYTNRPTSITLAADGNTTSINPGHPH